MSKKNSKKKESRKKEKTSSTLNEVFFICLYYFDWANDEWWCAWCFCKTNVGSSVLTPWHRCIWVLRPCRNLNFLGQRAHSKFLIATWTILWWRFKFDLFEKSRPHRRQGNFFGCGFECICCCLEGIISCSSIVFDDDDDGVIDDVLNICWCCWASKAAWCGLETIAIKAPVVGSINGGVAAAAAVTADDVGRANALYGEVNDKLAKSLLCPFILVENRFDRWCLDKWESNKRLGECFEDE